MRTTFSGVSRRPARTVRWVALVLGSLVLAGLGVPAASAGAGTATVVDRFFTTGDGGSVVALLIAEDVAGSSPTFALSATSDGGQANLVGGPECHSGTCAQWATYYTPTSMPESQHDGFTYTITDSTGTSAPADVSISYLPALPRPSDQLARVSPKGVGTIHFRAFPTDSHPVTFWPSSLPMRGTMGAVSASDCNRDFAGIWSCTATATFTPDLAATSRDSDSFYWQVEDDVTHDWSGTAYTVITFENAPVAQADTASVPNDRPTGIDVLANDTDQDGDALAAWTFDEPAHGQLSCAQKCTYTPDPGYLGTDSFSYNAYDGQMFSSVTPVSVTVTVPPPPVPAAPRAPVTCVPGAPAILSAAPGARRGPVTAVVAWAGPNSACAGKISRFNITALKANRRGAVVSTRRYTAPGSAHRLEVRLPATRSWRFQVSATNSRGTGARSRLSNPVVAR